MTSIPFMQLYVGDYLADTLHLTTEQHGAYLLLLMTMWRNGASLPNDPAKLARICRVSPKRWPLIWAEIAGFFAVEGDTITNPRLTKEHQKAVSISQERKTAGRKGGTAKALKKNDQGLANDVAGLKHSQIPEPEPEEDTSSLQSEVSSAAAAVRASACDPDKLHDDVMAAVGLTSGRIPTHWMPPAATIHVSRWMTDLGLTPAQIIDAARESRKRHDEPPNGPRALDGVMRGLAAAIQAPPMTPAAGSAAPRKGGVDLDAIFARLQMERPT